MSVQITDDVITTQELTLGYNQVPIVNNITLSIKKGEFIGILGPNGSGKSTFLRAVLGLVRPISGTIKVLDQTPPQSNTHIGYMPQMRDHLSLNNLTSRALLEATYDGLSYGFSFSGTKKNEKVQKLIGLVGATPYADRPFKQLSGGEKQRIYLAQSLLGGPSILLLDEPLSSLDPKYQEIFMVLLNDVCQQLNVTVLFTAHDPNPLLHIMDRVLFFAEGRAAIGTTEDIITSQTLSEMYGTPIEVIHLKGRLLVFSETQQNILGEVRHYHE
jgi:zinc/manganese transport system ATP-binding protein